MSRNSEQTTVARAVKKQGIGLHTGARSIVSIMPAAPGTGILFVADSGAEIPATAEYVVGTERATVLGIGDSRVSAVEHIMAALYLMGVDNARVEVDGPEIPACDGSALEWVELLRRARRKPLGVPRKVLTLEAPIWSGSSASWALIWPARNGLSLSVAVDFAGTVAGRQILWLRQVDRRLAADLAPARTFAFEHEVEALRAAGLAKGGGMDNAFTVGPERYSGPLRFEDEVVRHKALDLVGDLALCGFRLQGQVFAVRPGHRSNVALAMALRAPQTGLGVGA